MSSGQLNRTPARDPSAPPKHVTFRDTVEWASDKSTDKEESPTKKYNFWMLLLGVLAMVVVVWILIMFMSRSKEVKKSNGRANGKKSRNGGGRRKFSDRPVLDGMMSDSGSIRPDRGMDFRRRSHRSSRRGGGGGGLRMVDPLPPNEI